MGNRRKLMEMLVETKSRLDEITEQYKEINNVLDRTEDKMDPQMSQEQIMPEISEGVTTGLEHVGTGKNTAEGAATKPIDVKNKPELKMDSETASKHKTEAYASQTHKKARSGSTHDEASKTKGILKKSDTGTAQSYGFQERLVLILDHVMYGSRLRRSAVEMHQDNRLCLEFGLQPNVGAVYKSERPKFEDTVAAAGLVGGHNTKTFRDLVFVAGESTDIARPLMTKESGALRKGYVVGHGENAASGEAEGKRNKSSHLPKQTSPERRLPEECQNSKEEPFDDSQESRVDIKLSDWLEYAHAEIQKGRLLQDIRERGMDTIICLDVSSSMRGVAWQQAVYFIKSFIEGIQNTTLMDDVYEHVALVTFGSETRVQQHLTCDYLEILRKLDHLKPSGPTPMFAGLNMVRAALIGAGNIFIYNGYKIHPRVFLITDGKTSPASMIAGPDEYASKHSFEDEQPVREIIDKLTEVPVTINIVPVGEFNLNILEKIAEFSEGKIISPESWRMHTRTFKNYLAASKLVSLIQGESHLALRQAIDFVNPDATMEDKDQMLEFLRTHDREKESDEMEGMPPLGSRVRRTHELGTVSKHMEDGYIGVTWDEPNEHGTVREKVPYNSDMKGVRQVDEPRILHGDLIAEGCRVKRGRDWHYGDQDGGVGSLGNVFNVRDDGVVHVRWDNGSKHSYLFGANGKFDLEIIDQNELSTKRDKEDTTTARYSLSSGNETEEEKRVREMNEKNKLIYSYEDHYNREIEGAASGEVDRREAMVKDRNKRNVKEVNKIE